MSDLICTKCKRRFPLEEKIWQCSCGGFLDIVFQPHFPLDKIRQRKPTMWRYREAIPILEDKNIISFDEGFTPLIPVSFGAKTVWIKQDHLFPTGSYKDRGASILVSKIKELGIPRVIEDSSGNAGASIAHYAAAAGIGCTIFVPAAAPRAGPRARRGPPWPGCRRTDGRPARRPAGRPRSRRARG